MAIGTAGVRVPPASADAAVLLGAAAFAIAWAAGRTDPFVRIENTSYDWRVYLTARPAATSSPIVIVDINESTVRALAPLVGTWPWPRAVHAQAIDYPRRAPARRSSPTTCCSASTRAAATRVINGRAPCRAATPTGCWPTRSGRPVTSSCSATPSTRDRPGGGRRSTLRCSIPDADLRAGAADSSGADSSSCRSTNWPRRPRGVGHNSPDARFRASDFARRMLPFVDVRGVAVPSLGMAAALAFRDVARRSCAARG